MKRISHFWIENCAVVIAQAGRYHVRFGSKADIEARQSDVSLAVNDCIAGPPSTGNVRFQTLSDIGQHWSRMHR
jgi:hypothetical protein